MAKGQTGEGSYNFQVVVLPVSAVLTPYIFICHHQLNKWLRGFLHIAVFGCFLSLSGMPSHRHNVTRKFAFCGGWPQEVKSVCGAFSPFLLRDTEISVVNCIVEFQKSIYFTPFTENETALHGFSATYAPRPIVTLASCPQPVAVPAARTTSTSSSTPVLGQEDQ